MATQYGLPAIISRRSDMAIELKFVDATGFYLYVAVELTAALFSLLLWCRTYIFRVVKIYKFINL